MEPHKILPIFNSNPPSPSPCSTETRTCWDSFIKENQLTTFTIKEDQSLEFSLFEDSPIFNENHKGNLRKIQSRINTIFGTSSFPKDLVNSAKSAYKGDPQYMHLAIDRTDFSDMRIFDVLDEEFESLANLEEHGMLKKVEDEEFNWLLFGTCRDINWINAHQKDLEEDDDYYKSLAKKSKRGRKPGANPARIKKEKQEKNITVEIYWEKEPKRRRGGYASIANRETEIDEESEESWESFEAREFEIFIPVENSNEFEEEEEEELEKAMNKEAVLIDLQDDESEVEVVLVDLKEDCSETEQEKAVVLIDPEEDGPEGYKESLKARKELQKKELKRRGKERALKEIDYGLVNGKRRRVSSSEEFESFELVLGIENLIWPESQQQQHVIRSVCACEEDS